MSTERAGDAGSSLRLRNWRVRSRLVALILVPTAAAVLLGGVQVIASMNAAADYQRVNDLARLSDDIGALTHELAEERDRTAWFIALGRPERGLKGINDQRDAVDTAAERVRDGGTLLRGELTGRTGDEVEAALTRLEDLTPLRRQALETNLLPDAAIDAYTLVVEDLLSLHDELGKGSDDDLLFGQSLTLTALARAKESLSQQRALLSVVLVAGRFEQDQMEKFLGALSSERNGRKAFAAEAGTADRRFFDETVNGRSADRADFLRELVLLRAASGAPLKGLDQAESDDARQWFDGVSVTIDRMRAVEQRHAQGIVARSGALGDAEQNRALLVIGAVAALLLAVLLITTGVARSLVRPLRRLRTEALEVAGERLPSYVQRVRETRDGELEMDVPPIGIVSRDEIGEVARAFDEVHREAVRLAGDEAKLRNTVNAMFVNLSRRSQTLVERQLSLVERLERGERDDNRLADLFKLDHLATRMRRNSENLLVLAGQEVARRWRQPVEVMDIVRAALSEVENYDRVVTRIHSEVAVAGPAVSDVVHLLAELVENAVAFSPGETKVVVSSSRIDGGGVMIGVSDQGIGMTLEELTQANTRLAGPQAADAAAARRMGLFVVGRLAFKHGIRVQLRPQETGGLTAMVLLPERLIAPLPGPSFPSGGQPFAGADPS
ncbi:sensor histidine kinase, partial [Planobispora siamensis]